MSLLGTTAADLRRRVASAQAEWRSASVTAAVVRDGEQVFAHSAGLADDAAALAADDDVQYRIGSVTKTFTAVLAMALRDEGRLALDDALDLHLPGTRHGEVTVRLLLSHLSGLQREPVGDVWWTGQVPDRDGLLAGLEEAESVSSPHRRWHYSNLAYAVLGELVARLDGRSWEQSLQARVLDPLGLARTSVVPAGRRAAGYLTDPYADRLHREPDIATGGLAPAAQLWSTAQDLGRWASFWAQPAAEVLSPDTIEEMCQPQVLWDVDAWTLGWGLGPMLLRSGDRVLVGHEGAMPGFLAALWVYRQDRVGAVALANATSGAQPSALAAALVGAVLDAEPADPPAWAPGPPVDPQAEPLLGRWWSEGSEFVLSWRVGRLEARAAAAPPTRPPAVFAPQGTDLWRTVSGREAGELLRVVRDSSGAVLRLHWATYGFTRSAEVFGATSPDPAP
jgi:CubicO group peptidase (beta-lactamase class C family)